MQINAVEQRHENALLVIAGAFWGAAAGLGGVGQISVYQKSKSVWIAVGTYMGERVESKGTSESSAAAHWAAAAKYKGNG